LTPFNFYVMTLASCSHTRAFVTKQYNSVVAKMAVMLCCWHKVTAA